MLESKSRIHSAFDKMMQRNQHDDSSHLSQYATQSNRTDDLRVLTKRMDEIINITIPKQSFDYRAQLSSILNETVNSLPGGTINVSGKQATHSTEPRHIDN